MTDDESELDYPYLAQNALRGVVRDVLTITENMGHPPGKHHFYIEFLTQAPGVTISKRLKAQYPERMTIVLQHQFENLRVNDDGFEVTLYFKGVADHLVIPYDAVAQFADPSVNFALQFPTEELEAAIAEAAPHLTTVPSGTTPAPSEAEVKPMPPRKKDTAKSDDNGDDDPSPPSGSADVVSLDRFRKK